VSLATLALVLGLMPLPLIAGPLPFEGRWDCEVGVFSFTAESYDPGDGAMDILDVAAERDGFILTFADDYQIGLEMHADGTMTWYSAVSGDSFLCRPLP